MICVELKDVSRCFSTAQKRENCLEKIKVGEDCLKILLFIGKIKKKLRLFLINDIKVLYWVLEVRRCIY